MVERDRLSSAGLCPRSSVDPVASGTVMNPCSENFNTDEDVSADGRFVIHTVPQVCFGRNEFKASVINNQIKSCVFHH